MTEAQQLEEIERLRPMLLHFQKDPNRFFSEVLGAEPEEYQKRVNQAISDNERVAISACHDLGKTWDLARIALWFSSVFPYSKVITTAPTFNQVKNILWQEMRSAYARSKDPLGGTMNLTEWQIDDGWFSLGFTPRNELSGEGGQGTQSSFQGFHAPGGVLVIFDEATGIPPNIWVMVEGMMTSSNVKFVCIGNPTSRASEFYKCFSSPDWVKIKLSCFDSPNLIANGVTDIHKLNAEIDYVRQLSDSDAQARLKQYKTVKGHLLSLRWVVSMGLPRKWGVDHPLFVSKVLGHFPETDSRMIIPLGVVEAAQLRTYFPVSSDRKLLGVDLARLGKDETILTSLHGYKFIQKKTMVKALGPEIVGQIIVMARDEGPYDVITLDETGLGGPIIDFLRVAQRDGHLDRNTEIRGIVFGKACEDPESHAKFVNIKARMFIHLSDDLKKALTLPAENDGGDVYTDELPTIKVGYDKLGRYQIESKDDYKKRTGKDSPDASDSLALANFGRYDEVGVGKFGADHVHNNRSGSKPFAARLGDRRRW